MLLFEEFKRRGLIAQLTHEEEIKEKLNHGKVVFYVGFDATADSLHVGHLLQLIVMRRMQMAGHIPIALLGTGTTMVGDPTGRTDMRKMLTETDIAYNAKRFQEQMSAILDFSQGKALMLQNGDWLKRLNYISFLREVGRYFSVNKMLTAECVKTRLEKGLSFLEFNYMLMQSYDFLYLHNHYDCCMQLGGDDQWSNILGGIDLIRRVKEKEAYGMTFTLLTTKAGVKMGKTQSGAVWLDPEKFSPFDFYQYWRNVDDGDVIRFLKMLTFLPIEEIEDMEAELEGSAFNQAKELLAFEVTKLVHGEQEAHKAKQAARALFDDHGDTKDMPTTVISFNSSGKIGLLEVLRQSGLCKSNGEARRLILQGGISINQKKVVDPEKYLELSDFSEEELIIKKGKKTFHKIKYQ